MCYLGHNLFEAEMPSGTIAFLLSSLSINDITVETLMEEILKTGPAISLKLGGQSDLLADDQEKL